MLAPCQKVRIRERWRLEGRDLWSCPRPGPLPEPVPLERVGQEGGRAALERLPRRSLRSLAGQPVPGLPQPGRKEASARLPPELPGFRLVPAGPCPVPSAGTGAGSPAPSCCQPPSASLRPPLRLLFSRRKSPRALRLSGRERRSSPRGTLAASAGLCPQSLVSPEAGSPGLGAVLRPWPHSGRHTCRPISSPAGSREALAALRGEGNPAGGPHLPGPSLAPAPHVGGLCAQGPGRGREPSGAGAALTLRSAAASLPSQGRRAAPEAKQESLTRPFPPLRGGRRLGRNTACNSSA